MDGNQEYDNTRMTESSRREEGIVYEHKTAQGPFETYKICKIAGSVGGTVAGAPQSAGPTAIKLGKLRRVWLVRRGP